MRFWGLKEKDELTYRGKGALWTQHKALSFQIYSLHMRWRWGDCRIWAVACGGVAGLFRDGWHRGNGIGEAGREVKTLRPPLFTFPFSVISSSKVCFLLYTLVPIADLKACEPSALGFESFFFSNTNLGDAFSVRARPRSRRPATAKRLLSILFRGLSLCHDDKFKQLPIFDVTYASVPACEVHVGYLTGYAFQK
jgi:hypothetical protein